MDGTVERLLKLHSLSKRLNLHQLEAQCKHAMIMNWKDLEDYPSNFPSTGSTALYCIACGLQDTLEKYRTTMIDECNQYIVPEYIEVNAVKHYMERAEKMKGSAD